MGMVTRVRARSAWFGRLVSLPGTVDDIKAWGRVAAPILSGSALLWERARGWVVDRAAALAALDGVLQVIGWISVVLSVLVVAAVAWNTYQARRGRGVLPQIAAGAPDESEYVVLNWWGESGNPLRDEALWGLGGMLSGKKRYPRMILIKKTGQVKEIPYPPVHNRLPSSSQPPSESGHE